MKYHPLLLLYFTISFAGFCSAETQRLFIGTYTGGTKGSEGIYTSELDTEAGTLSEPVLAAKCVHPAFLAVHPNKPQLFAVGETGNSKLYSFTYRKSGGQLLPVDEIEIPGSSACHLCLCQSPNSIFDSVIVANYSSGNIVSYPIFESGKFGNIAANIAHQGNGPNAARQKEPHPHGIFFDSVDKKSIGVPDLGIDQVVFYNIDFTTAKLERQRSVFHLPPGTGPRHLAFSKDGRFAYVNGELNSTVCVFMTLGTEPQLIQTVSTLPEADKSVPNSTAEIELSPSGNFLYVSNRGHDSLAAFRVNTANGMLSLLETVSSGGKHPRFFTQDPSGQFLLSCNKDSNNIVVFRIDRKTGKLYPTGNRINIAQPVCVKFAL